MCFIREPPVEDLCLILGYNLAVPPRVRQALFSRSFDDDLLPMIGKPALVVHGAQDDTVKPSMVDQHKAGMPQAQVRVMSDAGHAPFWDDPVSFNQHLRAL
jgi:non-heme chloroperoxidase